MRMKDMKDMKDMSSEWQVEGVGISWSCGLDILHGPRFRSVTVSQVSRCVSRVTNLSGCFVCHDVSWCVGLFQNVSRCFAMCHTFHDVHPLCRAVSECFTMCRNVKWKLQNWLQMRGHGVKGEEITMVWKPVAALIQSKERRELSEVICLFTFLCAWNWSRGRGTSPKLVVCVGIVHITKPTFKLLNHEPMTSAPQNEFWQSNG